MGVPNIKGNYLFPPMDRSLLVCLISVYVCFITRECMNKVASFLMPVLYQCTCTVRYSGIRCTCLLHIFSVLCLFKFYEILQLLNDTAPSPIDIAKAYMANRTSESNLGSKSIISKDERPTMLADDFASEPFVPFASPKPSICWPGSMVNDQRSYLTPQSQRGRFGVHNIPRTPYSRTIYSKSKSKVWTSKILFVFCCDLHLMLARDLFFLLLAFNQLANIRGEGDAFLNGSFSPLQQPQTPAYGQVIFHD